MTRAALLLPLPLLALHGCQAVGPTAYVALGVATVPLATTALQIYRPGAPRAAPGAGPLVVVNADHCSITGPIPAPAYVTR